MPTRANQSDWSASVSACRERESAKTTLPAEMVEHKRRLNRSSSDVGKRELLRSSQNRARHLKMADNNWQKVREIFDSALRRQPEERRKFVIETCGEDKLLLSEVESLLSSLDSTDITQKGKLAKRSADIPVR